MISYSMLLTAWQEVKTKGASGGIDRLSIQDFAENEQKYLLKITAKLKNKTYLPQAYLQIKIPKEQNEKRILGLATIHDKIVQTAIKNLLETRFEKHFFRSSYAYREGLGPRKAINKIRHYIQAEKHHILAKCDIDNYFDTIDHKRLFRQLKPLVNNDWLLQLIGMFVKMGYVENDKQWKDRTQGVPQGAVLSPLLANLYLTPLDQRMLNKQVAYVRYADDFVMLFKDRHSAQTTLDETVQFLQKKLKLKVNPGSFIRDVSHGFNFLGVWITGKEITISSEKIEKLKNKIKIAFNHPVFPRKYHDQVNGINNYYGRLIAQHVLFTIDEFILRLWYDKLSNLTGKISKRLLRKQLKNLLFVTDIYNRNINLHRKNIIETVYELSKEKPVKSVEQAVRKRKTEYLRRFMADMHLHISGYGKSIGISKNKIIVKNADRTTNKFPTKNLRYITISGRPVNLSTEFINFCVQNGISIDLVKKNGQPYAKIFDFNHIYVKTWTRQEQATQSGKSLHIAKNILAAKINNQIKLIKYFGKYARHTEEDIKLFMPSALHDLNDILKKIQNFSSPGNEHPYHETLMGYEGIASSVYWQWFRMMIDEETGFRQRITYKAHDPVNSMLNYGYAILYRLVWNSVLAQGLHPEYGFLHKQARGKASLVFDLIEPFRQPVVDRAVISLINKKTIIKTSNDGKLDNQTKQKLILAVDKNLARYEKYLKKTYPVIDQIARQSQHLRMFIHNQVHQFKPYQLTKW